MEDTLGKDFTNIEQGRRLLAIGLPVNSSNCHYAKGKNDDEYGECVYDNMGLFEDAKAKMPHLDLFPCWTIGRLMYILDMICTQYEKAEEYPNTLSVKEKLNIDYVEYLVKTFEYSDSKHLIDLTLLNIK